MLPRYLFFILLLISTNAWSAGITVCVRGILEIYPIIFLEEGSKLSSFSMFKKQKYCDDGYATIEENPDLSLSILYPDRGVLNNVSIDDNGQTISGKSYQPTDFNYNQNILIGGIPHLYSQTEKNIMRWDSDLESWSDLGATLGLPSGNFSETSFSALNNFYFSVDGDSSAGIWMLNDTSVKKVSDNQFGHALISVTSYGVGELIEEGNSYFAKWWNNPAQPKEFGYMPGQVGYFRGNSNLDGTLFQFQGTGFLKFLWDANDEANDKVVSYPTDAQFFRGCFSSRLNIFCSFLSIEGKLNFYRLDEAQFIKDSEIDSELAFPSSEGILSFYAVGKSRFITTRNGATLSLYELNESGLTRIKTYSNFVPGTVAGTYFSRNSSRFYWIEPSENAIEIYRASLKGSLEYESIIDTSINELDENKDDTDLSEPDGNERNGDNGSGDSSSDENGIGGLGLLLNVFLWVLLGGIVRKNNYLSV